MMNVRNINFSYGAKKVLDDVSFDIERNTVLSILGPNGVGKTTLLKCICAFHDPDSGTVTVNGNDVRGMSRRELARNIAYVPQKVMPNQTTVFDSVLIGRRPYIDWAATREDKEIAWDAIVSLGLEDLSLNFVDQISGGEFQKVQIARALVQGPNVLILDEPTNNLDMSNQHISMHMIVDAVRSKGICTIMTMHDINLAIHYSDRFLFMKDGKVSAFGDVSIITEGLVKKVYGLDVDVVDHKGIPYVIPCRGRSDGNEHMHSHPHPHDVTDHLHRH